MTPTRPAADALLQEAQRLTRGRLKIFLGAAPGVGKTYEMLQNARRKQEAGVSVLVGVVETHGRAQTEVLLEGLPLLPRRQLVHRGRSVEEFDLDAALAQRPALILVDELAHSNAPGSRHARRYQDVQELLNAGIDVFTTLNVQHLESYNDLVERITGVVVRETVPDSVLDLAHDIELIDLPPDELIERLRQGKVYVPEQAQRALEHFFTRGNLLALRELALRAAAERVDDDIASFKRARGIAPSWPMRGRVLVCIDSAAHSEDLLRAASRLADQRHVPWTALHVQTLGSTPLSDAKQRLEQHMALAAELGGDTALVTADRIGPGIVDYARACNASQILVGRPQRVPWLRSSLAHWLFAHAREFEVTVANQADTPKAATRPPWLQAPHRWLGERDVMAASLSIMVVTLLAVLLERWLHIDEPASLFLLGVVAAGAWRGLGAAWLSCALGFLAFNFFFTEPRYTLSVNSAGDVRALLLLLSVGTVVGWLSGRMQRQAADAQRNSLRTALLFDFSRRLATAVDERDLRQAAASGIADILGAQCQVLAVNAAQEVSISAELQRMLGWRDIELAAANWCAQQREMAGFGTTTLPAATWCFVPLTSGEQTLGVLALARRLGAESGDAAERQLLHSLQAQLANAWQRLLFQRQAEHAKVQRAAEQLRAALLASVSHDLRTPLVSIIGSLSAMTTLAGQLDPHDQAQLVETALLEAERLNRLIQNLLDATRLAQRAQPIPLSAVDVQGVLQAASGQLPDAVTQRLTLQVVEPSLAVQADSGLLQQVLVNLFENAAKYSPAQSSIVVRAWRDQTHVCIGIINSGPGIAPGERSRVFDFFYRLTEGDSAPTGSGLGLAICKGFVEAMNGSITVTDHPEGHSGVMLVIRLNAVT